MRQSVQARGVAVAAAMVCLASGCTASPTLAGAQESARALATAVLAAVAQSDRQALERLAVDEREFRDHVWPHLPAARPERNLPFSYVWGDLHQKSQASLGQVLAKYRGRAYELVDVRFDDGQTPYADVIVHRHAVLVVRGPGGQEEIRVCGSFLEKDGRWKVFSYVVDD
ncbi:MAG: hypothetical protein AB7U83_15860 [Vicinamibacterales bacterium]